MYLIKANNKLKNKKQIMYLIEANNKLKHKKISWPPYAEG